MYKEMTIDQLVNESYGQALISGFYDGHPLEVQQHNTGSEEYRRAIAEKIALIHSEASEALEEVRANQNPLDHYYREDGKPEGLGAELADVVIRVADLAGVLGLDLEGLVVEKTAFNRTRPYKHSKEF